MPRGRRKNAVNAATNGNGAGAPIGDEGKVKTNTSWAGSSVIERGTAQKLAPTLITKDKREPCLCGCGQTPKSGTAIFMPGHDSRVRHLGKQILAGSLKESDLSAPQRKYLREGGMIGA